MIRVQRRFWVNRIARNPTLHEEKETRPASRPQGPAELGEARRNLAALALDRRRQNGVLGVRQHEVLRRTLTFSGKALGWDLLPGSSADRLSAAKKDVATLAEAGVDLLKRDLADTLARKRTEIASLKQVVAIVRRLAVDANAAYPAEVTVAFTARSGLGRLVTKTEALVLGDGAEALRVAEELEKRENDRTRLRDQMVEELKQGQRQLNEMMKELPSFVESAEQVVAEVLAMPT
jgi:hypothetical protein